MSDECKLVSFPVYYFITEGRKMWKIENMDNVEMWKLREKSRGKITSGYIRNLILRGNVREHATDKY